MFARVWLWRLGERLSSQADLFECRHFLVLEAPKRAAATALSEFADRTMDRLLEHLRGIAVAPAAPLAIVLLTEMERYYDYVSDFYPERGEFATSGGMFIGSGYRRIVLPGGEMGELERVMAHELSHGLVSHLDLPVWLDEGIAVSMESIVCGRSLSLTAEEIEEHRVFWDRDTIQEFWSGASFSRPDDGNRLSYGLAEILVQTLAKDYDTFVEFANQAKGRDGGEQAAHAVFGRSLEGLPSALLGDGPWRPAPASW